MTSYFVLGRFGHLTGWVFQPTLYAFLSVYYHLIFLPSGKQHWAVFCLYFSTCQWGRWTCGLLCSRFSPHHRKFKKIRQTIGLVNKSLSCVSSDLTDKTLVSQFIWTW